MLITLTKYKMPFKNLYISVSEIYMNTECRRELMEYKDFITEEQDQIFIIEDEETFRLLSDSKYSPIFVALNQGPMTIKELVKAYNALSESPKKQTSIYNYLMDLMKHDLVLKVGQRIISGKTAAEVLYAGRAKFYYSSIMTEEFWNTDRSKKILERVTQLLLVYTLSEGVSEENLTALFKKIYTNFHKEVGNLFLSHRDEIGEIVSPLSFSQMFRTTSALNMLMMILSKEDHQEELRKCFPSITEKE